jgi:hypothetical protein
MCLIHIKTTTETCNEFEKFLLPLGSENYILLQNR